LPDTPALRVRSVTTYNDVELVFNTKKPPFDDVRVRRALGLAVDRNRLVSSVFRGFATPADDIIPPQSAFHSADPSLNFNGDVPGARTLLDAAGWRPGPDGIRRKNGVPLAFVLTTTSGYPTLLAAGVQLQAMWRAAGAEASLKPVQSNVLLAPVTGLLPRGDFDADLRTYGSATSPDHSDTLTTTGLPPAGRNYARYTDPDVDRWTEQARETIDDKARAAVYARISQRIRRDAPYVPVLWQKQIYVYTGALEGLRPEPINSDLWNVYDWQLKS
jgi:peptide/nickel transport system substrate-binding protein